jgi:tRNA C32,U32 (ribose-2'-O)-methylase TrmJ
MHINVSGGNAAIGNISQGHGNQLRAEQTKAITEEQIEGFYQALEDLIGDKNIAQQEVLALKREVQQLQQNAGQSTIAASVQPLCKKYAWAAEPLKALLGL